MAARQPQASGPLLRVRASISFRENPSFESLCLICTTALLLLCGATAANGQSKKRGRSTGTGFSRDSASIRQAQAPGAPAAPVLFAAAAPQDPDAARKLKNAASALVAKRKVQSLHSLTPEALAGQGQTQLQRQSSASSESSKDAEPSAQASSSSGFTDLSDPAYIQRVWRARR